MITPRPVSHTKSEFVCQDRDPGEPLVPRSMISPASIPNAANRKIASKHAPSNDRSQLLLQSEATRPAESAQQTALKLIATDSRASIQVTPPKRNGIVGTGSTARQSV